MNIQSLIAMSVSLRVGLLVLGATLFYNHITSGNYFDQTLSPAQQQGAVQTAADRDMFNDEGMTGLMFAAVYGQLRLAQLLVEYGANLNLQSKGEQQTALHYATNNMRVVGSQTVGYYLVDAYANTMLKNKYGQIPLHLVISTDVNADRSKMVEWLVKNGSDINAQTGQGDTLMHLAVNIGNTEWIEKLLRAWASIINLTIKNNRGLTPRSYAQELGFENVIAVLDQPYERITTAEGQDANGLTGLMLAVMRNDQPAIKSLSANRSTLNRRSRDRYQNTALHIALAYQNVNAVEQLLAAGASVRIRNAAGQMAGHYLVRVWDPAKQKILAPAILKRYPAVIATKDNTGATLLNVLISYNAKDLLEYCIKSYKPVVRQAATMTTNRYETIPQQLDRLNRPALRQLMTDVLSLVK